MRTRVAGTYDDLAKQPPQDFWCLLVSYIYAPSPFSSPPPPVTLVTDYPTLVALSRALSVPNDPTQIASPDAGELPHSLGAAAPAAATVDAGDGGLQSP